MDEFKFELADRVFSNMTKADLSLMNQITKDIGVTWRDPSRRVSVWTIDADDMNEYIYEAMARLEAGEMLDDELRADLRTLLSEHRRISWPTKFDESLPTVKYNYNANSKMYTMVTS